MASLPQALRIVWLILSAVGGLLISAPVFLGDRVFQLAPECPSKARGERCIACGMTTAFSAITRGQWEQAQQANAAAIPLYGLLAINFCGAAVYALRRTRRRSFS